MAKKTEFIDIKGVFNNYLKHWWWFVISVILCVALGFAYSKIRNPEYAVRANVLINEDDSSSDLTSSLTGFGNLFGASANVENEVFIIASHSVLRDVARDLGVNKLHYVKDGLLKKTLNYPDYPVDVYAESSLVDTLMTTILFKTKIYTDGTADVKVKAEREWIADVQRQKLPVVLKTSYGRFVINKTKACPKDEVVKSNILLSGYDVAAEGFAEDITCEMASKKSDVIELGLKTENTVYGEDVLNEIIKKYNERGIAEKRVRDEKTAQFLDERLALIAGDLDTAESNIQTYKQSQGIIDVGTEASYNLSLKSSSQRKLIELQTQNEIIKMARDFLALPQNAFELIPAAGPIAQAGNAIDTYNEMILRRMELKQNAKTDNVRLKQLDEQINAMRRSVITTLDRAYDNSCITIRDAQNELAKAESKLGNVPSQERAYLGLKRQQEVKQQLYLFLLQRREETAMLLANAVPKGSVIDNAYTLSKPLTLSKIIILIIAFVIGLFLPIVAIYIKGLLRSKFSTRQELEQLTELPVLGEICADTTGRNLVVGQTDTSSTTELFRLVRSSLQFMLNDVDDKVVLVTSTSSGEGKSFISLNIAASLALLGKKIALVGMDIRNPRLADYLGLSNKMGLTVYLSQSNVNLDDVIIHHPEVNGLDVIVGGPVPPNPGELLASNKVDELFATLRERYDLVIVDSAPVGMVSDTFNLVRISDATVYVCRVNYTSIADINFVNKIYEDKRMHKLSLVVNGTKTSKGYGYGYGRSNTKS